MIRAALGALLLLLGMASEPVQAQSWIQFATCGTPPRTLTPGSAATIGADLDGNLCISGTISTTVTFPTIGAAVPATGIYNGVNVAGTLRGWSGLSTGSLFPGAVAIVDASGNQITSFGGSSATFGAAFPATGTAIGFSDGTNLAAPRVGAVANVAAATGFVDSLGVCQYLASAPTLTDTRFNQVQCDVNGYMRVTVQNTNANGQATMANSSPVVIASNQTANALWGQGATGAAVPANAQYMGFNSGGNLTAPSITAPLPVNNTGPYPIGATPYTATATGTTGATTATLAGASSVTTYICGFSIRANATAAVTNNATVTGVITATLNFTQWTAPNASGLGITEMIFSPCIPASGTNQSIAVVSGAPGTGGVVSVTAWGYKL